MSLSSISPLEVFCLDKVELSMYTDIQPASESSSRLISSSTHSIAGDVDMGHTIASSREVPDLLNFDISRMEPEQLMSCVIHDQYISVDEYTNQSDTTSDITTLPSVVPTGSSNGTSPRCPGISPRSQSQPQVIYGGATLADDHDTGEQSKEGVTEHSFGFYQSRNSFGNEQKINTHKPLSPDSVTYLSIASIVGGLLTSVTLAIGHHLFLSYLHARNIDGFSQFWTKGIGNSFATLFSVCLGFSATSALTQTKWRVVASERARINNIDHLFALPAPLALCGIIAHPCRRYFPPVMATILIHALVLVSVLAPNSLTTARSQRRTREIQIPTLDLGAEDHQMTRTYWHDNGPTEMNISAMWEAKLLAIMLGPPDINWLTPPECGAACTFEWQYEAPGLECRDITPDEYTLTTSRVVDLEKEREALAYQGKTTLVTNRMNVSSSQDLGMHYNLSIQYATVPSNTSFEYMRPGSGVYCQFRHSTYKGSFELANNTRRVNTSVLSYGDPLSAGECQSRNTVPLYCENWGPNAWAMSYTFASAFEGNITLDALWGSYKSNMRVPELAAIGTMFNITYESLTIGMGYIVAPSFDLEVSNLSESLVGLFSNFTLGLIPYRSGMTTTTADVWDGNSVWNYTPWILWTVYMPAFLLAIPVTVHGLRSIQLNETGMEDKFSTFLLTTRGATLDNVCKESEDFEALQRVRLVHRKKGVFTVESTNHAT